MRVIYSEKSLKSLKKLDKPIQKMIIHYMEKVGQLEEPRARGKAVSANLRGFWRYRVSNYRIICKTQNFYSHQKKPHNVAFNYSFMNKFGAV